MHSDASFWWSLCGCLLVLGNDGYWVQLARGLERALFDTPGHYNDILKHLLWRECRDESCTVPPKKSEPSSKR